MTTPIFKLRFADDGTRILTQLEVHGRPVECFVMDDETMVFAISEEYAKAIWEHDRDGHDWEGHPDEPVSPEELKRLIAEDYLRGGR